MTVVAAIVDRINNSVIVGSDSAGIEGYNLTIRKDPKVFIVGDFVIGCTSSFRMIQLLRYSLKLPDVGDKDIYEYMCTDFVTAVRECFNAGGFLQREPDGDEKGGTFIVAYKTRIFIVNDDFDVGESIEEFEAVGCGSEYAKGAMYALDINAYDKLNIALEAACHFSTGCSRPLQFKTTQTEESKTQEQHVDDIYECVSKMKE